MLAATNWSVAEKKKTIYEESAIKKISNALMKSYRHESLKELTLVDAIQRLGIEYYFEGEIKAILDQQYLKLHVGAEHSTALNETALRFRLLRQEGYCVSADMFVKFKNENGTFRAELSEDIQGLMSLFEASELRVEAEDILAEAYEYSRQVLDSVMENHQHQPLVKIVGNTLKHPLHKSLPKFTSKNSLCNFNDKKRMRKELRDLANMDFIMAKAMYREEMHQVSCWWDNLGLAKEMKFARNQPLKWYMWPVAAIPDPSMSEMRIEIVKTIAMIYVIDDLFDVYGTLDDLSIFTVAVNRWDFSMVEVLPNCMRACLKALYDITDGIGHHIYERHGINPKFLMRKMWANLCNAFLVEARWFDTGYVPSTDNYLKNGIISTGVHVVLAHLFFLMGEDGCDNKMDVSNGFPSIMDNIATILRLWDDLGSAKDENQDGKDGSFVECYLNENKGSSVDDAREHVKKMISDAWKRLNEDYLTQYPFSLPFKKICLNFARMVPMMYNHDDNHSLPILKKHMKTFLSQDTQNPNQD
ncbi:hypothetical protein Droror1_Dr00020774 [Drosera rotundifolia]